MSTKLKETLFLLKAFWPGAFRRPKMPNFMRFRQTIAGAEYNLRTNYFGTLVMHHVGNAFDRSPQKCTDRS
jgi:hypothetical protein